MKYLTVDIFRMLIKKKEVQGTLARKNLTVGIGVMVGLVAVLAAICLPANSVWAATIQCHVDPCFGTVQSDTMIGDSDANDMHADDGNDIMSGKDGADIMAGADGNDAMSGGNGNDRMRGGSGSEQINGGSNSDEISHGITDEDTAPDGSRDVIDCGSGNDEAWINVSVDHDIATNCEIVHSG